MGAEFLPCYSCVKFGVGVLLSRVRGNINVCDKPLHISLASLGLSHFLFQPMAASFQVPQDLRIDFPLSSYGWVPKGFMDVGHQSKPSKLWCCQTLKTKVWRTWSVLHSSTSPAPLLKHIWCHSSLKDPASCCVSWTLKNNNNNKIEAWKTSQIVQCICLLCPKKRVKVVGLFPFIFLAHKHASCSHTGLVCWSTPAVCFILKSSYWGETDEIVSCFLCILWAQQ